MEGTHDLNSKDLPEQPHIQDEPLDLGEDLANIGLGGEKSESDDEIEEEESEPDQIPLLFVDVNLGEGNQDRIVLYDGDEPSQLAQEFSVRHSLDDAMK